MLIGELSRRTGVSRRLLRYYEEQGLLEVTRRANGYRDYDDDAVTVVQRVRLLLDAGLPTEVIRRVLPCVRGTGQDLEWCTELRTLLTGELRVLDDRIDELQRRRGALAGYLTRG
jgi:DNA-binding transcriptional MerR regulator